MKLRRALALVPAAMLVVAAHARAQSPTAGWPESARAQLRAILDSATQQGLPVTPLNMKVAEGVAKGAPPERIVPVVRALGTALRDARQLLGRENSEAELVAAAAALQAGIPRERLRELRAALRTRESSTQLFVVIADLTQRGVKVDEGADVLLRLARAGAGGAAFEQLRLDVATDVIGGLPPQAAMMRRSELYLARGFTPAGGVFRTPDP